MRPILLFLSLFILSSCALFQPSQKDLFYTDYESNPDYSTRKMGTYFVVLTFRPNTIYNSYTVEEPGVKFVWRMGDNEIMINKDELSINKKQFGNIEGARIVKIDKGKVYIDDKYRKALK
ncbi:hypothetical protein PQO03_07860 [Lentisphaera profundi]|uniref:Uncharacterized protein n=1 Tax=Lentisphaera profundi TaxID=1658616 RepID=A0ABY7VQW6_9BACT|nr:hypothetical protein [Lentisphaera profundi]WDE95635.1 hypothetical protein PQO03_07860 [Lentisphaera profundi]